MEDYNGTLLFIMCLMIGESDFKCWTLSGKPPAIKLDSHFRMHSNIHYGSCQFVLPMYVPLQMHLNCESTRETEFDNRKSKSKFTFRANWSKPRKCCLATQGWRISSIRRSPVQTNLGYASSFRATLTGSHLDLFRLWISAKASVNQFQCLPRKHLLSRQRIRGDSSRPVLVFSQSARCSLLGRSMRSLVIIAPCHQPVDELLQCLMSLILKKLRALLTSSSNETERWGCVDLKYRKIIAKY